jgi:hypothetical protein
MTEQAASTAPAAAAATPKSSPELEQALASANAQLTQAKNQIAAMKSALTSNATWQPGAILQWIIQNWATAQKLFGLVTEWQTITQPITDKAGMKLRIIVALKAAALIAQLTPDTSDDAIVAEVQNLLVTEGGIDIVLDLVWAVWKPTGAPTPGAPIGAIGSIEHHFQPAALANLKSRAIDRKINWGNLLQLLPTIISIIQIFTGVKIPLPTLPAPAPAAAPASAPTGAMQYKPLTK